MATVTADQARDLADLFLSLSRATLQYRLANADELSDDERGQLKDLEISLRDRSQDLAGLAGQLTLDDLESTLNRITAATNDMKTAINNIQTVAKVIGVATAGVKLAGAITTGNPMAILGAAKDAAAAATA
jgi:orotate phosphoribosyltransferase-like protein